MKIHIELVDDIEENEVIIRCRRVDDTINKIYQYIIDQNAADSRIPFYKKNQEYYIPLEDVLFFETENDFVYAHTANDAYRIKYRLYELEEILPRQFVRVSKSAIVNVNQIYSVTKNLAASSLVSFKEGHQTIYVSRLYYREMSRRLSTRNHKNK